MHRNRDPAAAGGIQRVVDVFLVIANLRAAPAHETFDGINRFRGRVARRRPASQPTKAGPRRTENARPTG